MSGLLDSLSIASSSLDAQRMGMDVVGQNLANLNTEGYTRRALVLGERAATDSSNAGRGVEVLQIKALRDVYLDSRLRQEQQGTSSDAATVDALSVVETAFGQPGQSVDAAMTSFFDAFSTLAVDATSPESRDAVVQQGQGLATSFNLMAARLTSARHEADSTVTGGVDDVNRLAAQVALMNGKIASANGSDVETLTDQRTVALQSLAQLANIVVTQRSDGAVDVSIGQGRPIVMGATSYALAAGSSGASGLATILSGGTDITAEITGGKIGGALSVRDTLLPGYQNRLDQLAFDLGSQVNAQHRAGFDATGTAGQDFFVLPGSAAGAASSISVNSAIAANSSLVAASSTGTAGDNQTARAIAGLRDVRLTAGGTATANDAWAGLVYQVGSDSANAQASQDSRQQVIDQLQRLRDNVSGVSTDEEAAQLMRFQRAYEANARYFTTISSTLDSLMAMVP